MQTVCFLKKSLFIFVLKKKIKNNGKFQVVFRRWVLAGCSMSLLTMFKHSGLQIGNTDGWKSSIQKLTSMMVLKFQSTLHPLVDRGEAWERLLLGIMSKDSTGYIKVCPIHFSIVLSVPSRVTTNQNAFFQRICQVLLKILSIHIVFTLNYLGNILIFYCTNT